jgi:hypothetical protein
MVDSSTFPAAECAEVTLPDWQAIEFDTHYDLRMWHDTGGGSAL